MNKLDENRKLIEQIDKEMAILFIKRLNCAKEIASYKKDFNLPIYDKERELQLIQKNSLYVNSEYLDYYINFLENIISISKDFQSKQ